jgi:hypothetical protein
MKLKEKTPLMKEGILVKIVDNFFSALKRGVADRYISAAEDAGVDPKITAHMKEMEKYNRLIAKQMQKYK